MPTASVVIDDLHVRYAFFHPDKAHAPLVVDANAVLAPAIPTQQLQSVAWRAAQKIQRLRRVQLRQLAFRYGLNIGKPPCLATGEKTLGVLTFEREDRHGEMRFYIVYRYSVSCLCGSREVAAVEKPRIVF